MVADVFDFEKVDDLFDALARLDLFRAGSANENGGRDRIGAQPGVHADQNVVDHGLVLEHRQILEGAGNAEPRQRVCGQPGEIVAVEQNAAGGGAEHRTDQIEQRGLAGAVRADQAADLAGFDRKAHLFHSGQAAEALGNPDDVQKCAHDSHRLRRL